MDSIRLAIKSFARRRSSSVLMPVIRVPSGNSASNFRPVPSAAARRILSMLGSVARFLMAHSQFSAEAFMVASARSLVPSERLTVRPLTVRRK